MAQAYPWKCRNCGAQAVKPTVVNYSVEMEHDGQLYQITVPDLEVLECAHCKNRVLTDTAHRRLADALREKAGFIKPEEIKAQRERLGLTRSQLALLLKVAEPTVARWETGGQIQQRAMNEFLNAFFALPALREYLRALRGIPPADLKVTPSLHRSPAPNNTTVEQSLPDVEQSLPKMRANSATQVLSTRQVIPGQMIASPIQTAGPYPRTLPEGSRGPQEGGRGSSH